MGCCFPCFKSHTYTPIDGTGTQMSNFINENGESAFRTAPSLQEEASALQEFDLDSPVFKGTRLEQKFANKAAYDVRFGWINLSQRTINISEHMTKDRRHKEASLTDVVNVVAGPPEKYKMLEGKEHLNINKCLSIKFVRGGGIDLRFSTENERNQWYDAIIKIVRQQSSLDRSQTGVGSMQ
eukprot:gene9805-13194_t